MKRRSLYLTDRTWFESGNHKDPVCTLDRKLEVVFPEFYSTNYDLKLLVSKEPTEAEKESVFYNDSIDKAASCDISVFDKEISGVRVCKAFLVGFSQEHFEYLIPLIKDTVEVIYLFKCPKIRDLAILSECKSLKCLHIFWNNTLESLWNMKDNRELKVLSFLSVTKLKSIEPLADSKVEYITFDSADNTGNKKEMYFNADIFDSLLCLKHLTLNYKNVKVDY